jgi:hypothetical protein
MSKSKRAVVAPSPTDPALNTPLTDDESRRLEEREATIERGLDTFYAVGSALCDIRDERLYRGTYTTFEAYCCERWGMTRGRANQLIRACAVVGDLDTTVSKPENEAQVRPLVMLDPPRRREAWSRAVSRAPEGKPTAKQVEEAVRAVETAGDETASARTGAAPSGQPSPPQRPDGRSAERGPDPDLPAFALEFLSRYSEGDAPEEITKGWEDDRIYRLFAALSELSAQMRDIDRELRHRFEDLYNERYPGMPVGWEPPFVSPTRDPEGTARELTRAILDCRKYDRTRAAAGYLELARAYFGEDFPDPTTSNAHSQSMLF